jgi:hypothetical protein
MVRVLDIKLHDKQPATGLSEGHGCLYRFNPGRLGDQSNNVSIRRRRTLKAADQIRHFVKGVLAQVDTAPAG